MSAAESAAESAAASAAKKNLKAKKNDFHHYIRHINVYAAVYHWASILWPKNCILKFADILVLIFLINLNIPHNTNID
jgi:hypothetical protein